MIPKPVLGIVMLYQVTPVQTTFNNEQADTLDPSAVPEDLFYMKQYAQNACGTIALFHVILNSVKNHPELVKEGSYLLEFLEKVKSIPPEDKGKTFEKADAIKTEHKGASQQGQSAAQSDCDSHFIAFVSHNGSLWELDGMKKCPVNLGPCLPEEILEKGSQKIAEYMARDPENINFSMLVLAKNP